MLLRVGHLSTFYHTAMLLMADKSLCSGIDAQIEWRLFGTGPAIMNAFEGDEIDLAYIGLPPAIIGIARGVPVVCIAGGHVEGTVICGKKQYKGHPELNRLDDILSQFSGMTIGVPGKGSIHDVILQDYLIKSGLKQDISVKNYPWADMVLEAVVKDEVSAAFGTPALAVAVKRYAAGKILCPPELIYPNNPSYGIVVDKRYLHEHRPLIEQFLRSHEAATAVIRAHPAEAAEVIARHVGFIDTEFVLDTLGVSPKYCTQLTDEFIGTTILFVGLLKNLGYINRLLTTDDIFDRSLISIVHPENHHYADGIRVS